MGEMQAQSSVDSFFKGPDRCWVLGGGVLRIKPHPTIVDD